MRKTKCFYKVFTIPFALVVCFICTQAMAKDCTDETQYPLITTSDLKKAITTKSATIIDVNSKKSYSKHHVPGAIHYASSKKIFSKVLPKDKNKLVVAYCGGPMCTAWKKAAEKACELGYTNIRHYKKGIKGWVKTNKN